MDEFSQDCKKGKQQIVQGEQFSLTVAILDQNKVAYPMAGVSQIEAQFPSKVSGQFIVKKLTDMGAPITVAAGTSNVKTTLTPTDTSNLRPGKNQFFYLFIDFPVPIGRKGFKVMSAYDLVEAPAFV